MDAFTREVLVRLPLVEAVMRCWQWAFDSAHLQVIFDRHRQGSYEKVLTFGTVVQIVADALMEHRGSASKAIAEGRERGTILTTREAVYGKLRRIPISLSTGFLSAGTERLAELLPRRRKFSPVPESLKGFDVQFIDGKKIKQVPRLLKAARGVTLAVLGGKTISALSWETGLVTAIHAHPDGEVSDAPLVPGLLEQLVTREKPLLLVLDRQFCDLVQPVQLTRRPGDHYLIRYCHKVHFHRDLKHRKRHGRDAAGLPYEEEWGWLGRKKSVRVRRITLKRKAARGEPPLEPIILVTDLLDSQEYPAADLLEAYRARWGIETVFQKITEVFHLQSLISTTPEGTIFQFAFCMLLYNIVQLLTHHLSTIQKRDPDEISQEKLFYDVHRELTAWNRLFGPEVTAVAFEPLLTAEELRSRLQILLADAWTDQWIKTPPKKRSPPNLAVTQRTKGTHTSMFRLIHGPPAEDKAPGK